jgi:hypothetical protein
MSRRPRPTAAPARHVFHRPADPDALPPHSEAEEKAAIGCVMLAAEDGTHAEADAILAKLRPAMFYTEAARGAYLALRDMRSKGHALDRITTAQLGKVDREWMSGAMAETPSWHNFEYYRPHLEELALRRWMIAKGIELRELAAAETVSLEDTRARLAEIQETASKAGGHRDESIETLTLEDVDAYQPDPATYLIGENVISRQSFTVICGWPGLGKSRLTTTLALAGARGMGLWMGYPVRRHWRTFVLQSENSVGRIKSELAGIDHREAGKWIRFSKPCALSFHRPEFRRRLAQIWESWPFDCLVIDPWTDVVRDAEAGDVAEAFDAIKSCFPRDERAPAVVVVAHIRKQGRTDKWRPKSGSELMHEVLGSQGTVGKARTVFALQPGDPRDNQSDVVVLDCGKCNDGVPLPASAWHRKNGVFEPVKGFDFDSWMNPEDDGERKVINEKVLRLVLEETFLSRKEAVAAIVKQGFSEPAAYRALSADGKFASLIHTAKDGRLVIHRA